MPDLTAALISRKPADILRRVMLRCWTNLCEGFFGLANIRWRPIRDIATDEIAPEPPCSVHNTEAATCGVHHEITRFGHCPD
jgi:hypothetical protein